MRPGKDPSKQRRYWLGTLNFGDKQHDFIEHLDAIRDSFLEHGSVNYAAAVHERREEGTDHLHFFLHLNKSFRLAQVISTFQYEGVIIDWEWCVSPKSARDYVLNQGEHSDKTGTLVAGPWTRGEWKDIGASSKRSKALAQSAIEMVQSGMTYYDILSERPDIVFHHGPKVQAFAEEWKKLQARNRRLQEEAFRDQIRLDLNLYGMSQEIGWDATFEWWLTQC